MFKSKKLKASRQATAAAAQALTEAINLSQTLLAENQRLFTEAQQLRRDLLEALKANEKLKRKLDDREFLSAVGVKV